MKIYVVSHIAEEESLDGWNFDLAKYEVVAAYNNKTDALEYLEKKAQEALDGLKNPYSDKIFSDFDSDVPYIFYPDCSEFPKCIVRYCVQEIELA